MYLTIIAIASLLVMAVNVSANSLNVNALDFGLISKDTNVGSIDTDSLFNCFGAAITCDNDNTVNNNVAANNGTNGNNGFNPDTPLPPLENCETCFQALPTAQQESIVTAVGLVNPATPDLVCDALDELDTIGELVLLLDGAGLSAQSIVNFMDCLGIDITIADVDSIIG